MVNVYIGYDAREEEAFKVAKASIKKHSDIQVKGLIREQLKSYGYYYRDDHRASTEFTITRFLVPWLEDYKGFSIFVDCDVLVNTDLTSVMSEIDVNDAVSCVQHDYTPKSCIKMDGKPNAAYPRKNWSSMMVFNNELCTSLTNEYVNTAKPTELHRMIWANSIGSLHHTWNYLVGYYHDLDKPNIIHYTDGGPWFKEYENCDFADEWREAWQQI